MSHYIPKNDTNEKEILDSLEISDFEELVSIIPKNLRVKNSILGLNPGISEHELIEYIDTCLLYTSPSPRDGLLSRMPSSA